MHLQTIIHSVAIFGIENAAAHFQDSRAEFTQQRNLFKKQIGLQYSPEDSDPTRRARLGRSCFLYPDSLPHPAMPVKHFYANCRKNITLLQLFLHTTSPSLLRNATSPCRGGLGSPPSFPVYTLRPAAARGAGGSLHLDQLPQFQRIDSLIRHLFRGETLLDGDGVEVELGAVSGEVVGFGLAAVGLIVQ